MGSSKQPWLELTFFLGTFKEGSKPRPLPLNYRSQNQQSQLQYGDLRHKLGHQES